MASTLNWLEFRVVTSTPAELRQLLSARVKRAPGADNLHRLDSLDEKKGRLRVSVDYLLQEHSLRLIDLAERVDWSAC